MISEKALCCILFYTPAIQSLCLHARDRCYAIFIRPGFGINEKGEKGAHLLKNKQSSFSDLANKPLLPICRLSISRRHSNKICPDPGHPEMCNLLWPVHQQVFAWECPHKRYKNKAYYMRPKRKIVFSVVTITLAIAVNVGVRVTFHEDGIRLIGSFLDLESINRQKMAIERYMAWCQSASSRLDPDRGSYPIGRWDVKNVIRKQKSTLRH